MTNFSPSSLRALLAGSELFDSVDAVELDHLAARGAVRSLGAGVVVLEEGEPADAFYVIVAGRVAVRLGDASEEPIGWLERGDFFGEIALMIRSNRTATVTTESETVLLELPGADVMALAARSTPFRGRLQRAGMTRFHSSLALRLKGRATEESGPS